MRLCVRLKWLVLATIVVGFAHFKHTAAAIERHQHHRRQDRTATYAIASSDTAEESAKDTSSSSSSLTSSTASTATTWLGPEFMIVRRVYDDCQDKNDFIGCLKQKALQALSRALTQDSIKITDGLVLEKQNHTEKESIIAAIAGGRAFNNLAPLDRELLSKVDKLVRTHALKIDMSVGRGHEGGGGGGGGGGGHGHKHKHKKDGGHIKYIIAALLTAMGIAGPIGLKALAAIAGKALVISKVALTIASIIALKKLFSHDHAEESSFQVHAGDHNRRSTYVIRPVPKSSAVPAAQSAAGGSVDPYRYYYEYH